MSRKALTLTMLMLATSLGTGCRSPSNPPAGADPVVGATPSIAVPPPAPPSVPTPPTVAPPLPAEGDTPAVAAATLAADAWLRLVDGAQYPQSWDAAAAFFRGATQRGQWATMVGGVRGPLGAVRSRHRRSAQAATSLPGAPDGSYVIIQYDSSFEHKDSALETVTPMLDPDGQWRVSGYFIL